MSHTHKLLDLKHCDTLRVVTVKHLESALSYLMNGDAKNASLVLDSALHTVQELVDRVAPYAKG